MKADFDSFISYAHEDFEAADRLYRDLSADYTIWFDREQLIPGTEWELEIETATLRSRTLIALISEISVVKRGFVQSELKLALRIQNDIPSGAIFLIPARVEECEIPAGRLKDLLYVDLFPDWEGGVSRIAGAIEEAKSRNALAAATIARSRSRRAKTPVDRLRDLAAESHVEGRFHEERGQLLAARVAYTNVVRLRREVLTMSENTTQYRRELAGALINLGRIETDLGEQVSAIEHYSEAITLREQILKESPGSIQYLRELAGILAARAELRKGQEDPAGAKADREREVELRTEVLALDASSEQGATTAQ